jgi:hypothetical protein
MLEIGQRWKFAQAQVDFTITRIEDDRVFYRMNWSNPEELRGIEDYSYQHDGYGRSYVTSRRFDAYAENNTSIESFSDGTMVRVNG